VKPGPSVGIHHPMAPAPREAKLRFKAPTVVTPIDQLCRVVLTRGCDNPQTHADDGFLPPLLVIPSRHRGPTSEIYRESVHRIQQSRAVDVRFRIHYRSPKIAYAIGQIRDNIGRASEKIHGMKVADYRNRGMRRRIGNRNISEIKIAAVITVR